MGGTVSVDETALMQEEWLLEARTCTLKQLYESLEVYTEVLGSPNVMNMAQFDEVFGHMFADPEVQFAVFCRPCRVQGQEPLAASSVVQSLEPFCGLCFVMMGEAIQKMRFVYDVYSKGQPLIRREVVLEMMRCVTSAHSRMLNIARPSNDVLEVLMEQAFNKPPPQMGHRTSHDSLIDQRVQSEQSTRSQHGDPQAGDVTGSGSAALPTVAAVPNVGSPAQSPGGATPQKRGSLRTQQSQGGQASFIQFAELWEWCQDVSSDWVDPILSLSKSADRIVREKVAISTSAYVARSALMETAAKAEAGDGGQAVHALFAKEKYRPFVWTMEVMDLSKDHWWNDTPAMNPTDQLFPALRHLIMSDKAAMPVLDEKGKFLGLVDHMSVMIRLVFCTGNQSRRRSSAGTSLDLGARRRSVSMSESKEIGDLAESSMERVRRHRESVIFNRWITAGRGLVYCTLSDVLTSVMEQPQWYTPSTSSSNMHSSTLALLAMNRSRPQHYSQSESARKAAMQQISVSGLADTERPMAPTQFVFNLLERFAKGRRVVPVASSRDTCASILHMYDEQDLVEFFYENLGRCFGDACHLPVHELSVVRRPMLVKKSQSIADAVDVFAQSRASRIALVDSKGRLVGDVRPQDITALLLLSWREQKERGPHRPTSRWDLPDTANPSLYSEEVNSLPRQIQEDSAEQYNYLSILQRPIVAELDVLKLRPNAFLAPVERMKYRVRTIQGMGIGSLLSKVRDRELRRKRLQQQRAAAAETTPPSPNMATAEASGPGALDDVSRLSGGASVSESSAQGDDSTLHTSTTGVSSLDDSDGDGSNADDASRADSVSTGLSSSGSSSESGDSGSETDTTQTSSDGERDARGAGGELGQQRRTSPGTAAASAVSRWTTRVNKGGKRDNKSRSAGGTRGRSRGDHGQVGGTGPGVSGATDEHAESKTRQRGRVKRTSTSSGRRGKRKSALHHAGAAALLAGSDDDKDNASDTDEEKSAKTAGTASTGGRRVDVFGNPVSNGGDPMMMGLDEDSELLNLEDEGEALDQHRIQVLCNKVHAITFREHLAHAVIKMHSWKTDRLFIVDKHFRPLGVITPADLARVAIEYTCSKSAELADAALRPRLPIATTTTTAASETAAVSGGSSRTTSRPSTPVVSELHPSSQPLPGRPQVTYSPLKAGAAPTATSTPAPRAYAPSGTSTTRGTLGMRRRGSVVLGSMAVLEAARQAAPS